MGVSGPPPAVLERVDAVMVHEPPLVGRVDECRAITAALTATPAQGLVLAGPPGVGRTRLARESLEIAAGQGTTTRWAAGSAAAARVPLGALAHLLPPIDVPLATLPLLQQAARAICHAPGGRRPLLVVDDVHLLDDLSLTLLHQLGEGQGVTLVLTVRSDRTTTDPVSKLWKDGRATRVELRPLDRPDADELARQSLHGEVDSRTLEKLWRSSQGNPLFLRELIDDGRREGQLHDHRGVWRWTGKVTPSQQLAEIVLAQLGQLSPAESGVLEVLAAAGEPLHVDRVIELSGAKAVAALTRRGIVVDDAPGHSLQVRAAHPLYTEVMRSRASRATLRLISHQLTAGLPLPSTGDRLRRRGELMLDQEAAESDGAVLTEAACRANGLFDHELAEQLARAGIEAAGGVPAQLALIEALQWQGRAAQGEQVAVAAAAGALSRSDMAQLAAVRAVGLGCGLARPGEAFGVLRVVEAAVGEEDDRLLLAATEAYLSFLDGAPQRAVDLGSEAAKGCPPGAIPGALASAAAAGGLAVTGRCAEALAAVQNGREGWEPARNGPQAAFVHLALAKAEMLALLCAGRISDMQRRAAELQEENLTGPEWAGDAVLALYRGCAALAAGHPKVAARWLREALAGLQTSDPTGVRALCASELATAHVLAGQEGEARAVVAGAHDATTQLPAILRPEAMGAQVWLAAASGQVTEAAAIALAAASEAAGTDQWAVEALMLHTAARFGRAADVQPRISALADELDSPLVAVCAQHVRGVVDGDGGVLDQASARFFRMGATLMAADAAADAADAHEQAGRRPAATKSRATLRALNQRCDVGPVPGPVHPASSPLTEREAEVAEHAARGASNKQIAARLVLSVRTVEKHLANVYAKLGITNRRELPGALGGFPDDPLPGPSDPS